MRLLKTQNRKIFKLDYLIMSFDGAGGSSGGIGNFFIGLIMLIGGGYLLLDAIHIYNSFSMGTRMYSVGGMGVTSGFVLIPMMFGIGIMFYNSKNPVGWLLFVGSLVALIFGVITNIQFSFQQMSLFELLVILVLFVGGLGLMLSSLRGK
jgi:hypothetical protein